MEENKKRPVGRPKGSVKKVATNKVEIEKSDLDKLFSRFDSLENKVKDLKSENEDLKSNGAQNTKRKYVEVRCNITENLKLKRNEKDRHGTHIPLMDTHKFTESYFNSVAESQAYAGLFAKGYLTLENKDDYEDYQLTENTAFTIDAMKKVYSEDNVGNLISDINSITDNGEYHLRYNYMMNTAHYIKTGDLKLSFEQMSIIQDFFRIKSWDILNVSLDYRLNEKK